MDTPNIPDLLHAKPMVRFDLGMAHEVVRFAFTAGGSDVAEEQRMRPLRIAFSTWDPECFASDLFLEEFLAKHTTIEVLGQQHQLDVAHLRKILAHPPNDPETTVFRQRVLYELLTNAGSRRQLEEAYTRASRLFSLFEDSGLGYRLDVNRRRVDILRATKELVDGLASSFECSQSGLVRLRDFGAALLGSEAYARLCNVVEIEQNMTAIDARIRLGYEGQIRHFEIVGISDQKLNPFYATRIGRLVRRLLLLVRGYRFSDSEVLSQFVDDVFEGVSEEVAKIFQLLRDMEFYLAALHFHDHAARHGLQVTLPRFAPCTPGQTSPRVLRGLFNPLLVENGRAPTTCDLSQPRHSDTVILTGPNSGGKTRLLQSVSYCQMLGQAGFFVPAAEASLVWANGMFLSIGERANAGQQEGRLGTELVRIRQVFEHVRVGSFVVVDELCSGTNPEEGQEIFSMVLELMRHLHLQAIVSTHFLEFARQLQQTHSAPGQLVFLRVAVDAQNRPTYQFEQGVARSSLAHHAAARLGVTREELSALVARRQHELRPHTAPPPAPSARAAAAAGGGPVAGTQAAPTAAQLRPVPTSRR